MDYDAKRQAFAERDAFARFLGIELTDMGPGHARAEMELSERLQNGAGVAHGGAVFTLADLAFAAAANSHGSLALAINATISYFKAGLGKRLTAEAREIALHPKLATYAVDVFDETGAVIAAFQGTVYRKSAKTPGAPS